MFRTWTNASNFGSVCSLMVMILEIRDESIITLLFRGRFSLFFFFFCVSPQTSLKNGNHLICKQIHPDNWGFILYEWNKKRKSICRGVAASVLSFRNQFKKWSHVANEYVTKLVHATTATRSRLTGKLRNCHQIASGLFFLRRNGFFQRGQVVLGSGWGFWTKI